ncbi:hypothetical protein CDCA_CDCA11G3134 [Cyanidium caldarium]|uniref:peptidylprolyl isomerase n=1 Tax=Cyanidium caldarium TaxID=2771 RepID=A0AAV9IYC8_CYACA|nr:hypothetical protein CDCA_CDCA11G3134 [Cyanidium caldarium]
MAFVATASWGALVHRARGGNGGVRPEFWGQERRETVLTDLRTDGGRAALPTLRTRRGHGRDAHDFGYGVLHSLRSNSSTHSTAWTGQSRRTQRGDLVRVRYRVRPLHGGAAADDREATTAAGTAEPATDTLQGEMRLAIGEGTVLQRVEQALLDRVPGERFTVECPPGEAFGTYYDSLVVEVSREDVPADVSVGSSVYFGNGIPGKVVKMHGSNVTIDANHPLAGRAVVFELEFLEYASYTVPPLPPDSMLEEATFAGGDFTKLARAFRNVPGIVSLHWGYTQGHAERPIYETVCAEQTGHALAVHMVFDPQVIRYEELLQRYWTCLGEAAFTLNESGEEVGTAYRSGIYYHSEQQREAAQESRRQRAAVEPKRPVVTELRPAATFWLAEGYVAQALEGAE